MFVVILKKHSIRYLVVVFLCHKPQLMKPFALSIFLFVQFFVGSRSFAQTKGVLLDKNTHQPIPFVCICAKNGSNVSGTMSDENGRFEINFQFNSLIFSHVYYVKTEIDRKDVRETIYLSPKDIVLSEVVITSEPPKWINSVLKEVIKRKAIHYQSTDLQFAYDYETNRLSDTSGYTFHSRGDVLIPAPNKMQLIRLHASENTVKSKDKKALADFGSCGDILYDDFISNFNSGFLKKYTFNQNKLFKTDDPNLVQLQFNGKEYKDDEGYMVVDTLNKVILEYERKKGTNCNFKTQVPTAVRALFTMAASLKYDNWNTQIHVKYVKTGNSYLFSKGDYKFYIKNSFVEKKRKISVFWSAESSIKLSKAVTGYHADWLLLSRPWHMTMGGPTKEDKKINEALLNVPRKFEDF